ncbi:MAG: hypothetical protein M3Y72_09455, partial [Acidobacteriota bacterium]|nr:hypothetical protein [Acidobacteriota bacterium]
RRHSAILGRVKRALSIFTLIIASGLLVPFSGFAAQTAAGNGRSTQSVTKTPVAKGRPSSQQIADAKAKGLVWVNLATHVYHKDGQSYGTTRRGKFMAEDEAKKAGFRLASGPESRNGHK